MKAVEMLANLEEAELLMSKYVIKETKTGFDNSYLVYCHYPTTEPDVYVMTFYNMENAELFCKALNNENLQALSKFV